MSTSILQQNPFELFDLVPSFSIKGDEVEKQYIALQQTYHPDQMQDETISPMQASAHINDAYQQLKNPRKRAEWLLKQKNITVNIDNANHKPSPMILMESMEHREQLTELNDISDLSNFHKNTKQLRESITKELESAFEKDDLEQAATQTIRLRYAEKLLEEIKIKQHALMDA